MKCRGKFIKIFTILLLGLVAVNFSLMGVKEAVNPRKAHFIPKCENLKNHHSSIGVDCQPSDNNQSSDLMAYLFQIIFILFFISPPLIVILLFLIWGKLKARNRLK